MTAEEKKSFLAGMAGMFQGANMQNAQINMIVESGAKVVYQEQNVAKDIPHFPHAGHEAVGRQWYNFLISRNFIAPDTDLPCWLFQMGFSTMQPSEVHPIEWMKTLETARMMLYKVFGGLMDAERITKGRVKELAAQCFTKQGKPLKLAKPKKEYSLDADAIENFLPTVSDL